MEYGGGNRLSNNDHYFDPDAHKELVNFIKSILGDNFSPIIKEIEGKKMWSLKNLQDALEKRYGIRINPLRSRNIVWFEENGRKQYRIIDLKPQYLEKK